VAGLGKANSFELLAPKDSAKHRWVHTVRDRYV